MSEFRKFLSQLIFIAVLGAAVAFVYSLFLPKVWGVTGRIVIVPSGSSPTAGANLGVEAGNTAEMMDGPSFRKNILGENAKYFTSAAPVADSSTVVARFETEGSNLKTVEDVIAELPQNIATYTRDIYGGSPFKYLIAGDPEISARPVSPDMIRNVFAGFGAGALVYFLYWLYAASLFEARGREEQGTAFPAEEIIPKSAAPLVFSPDLRSVPEAMRTPEAKEEIAEEPQAESTAQENEPELPVSPRPMAKTAAAPANLPFVEQAPTPSGPEEPAEPTDDEVKERLNRLMRGEL